MKDYIVEKIKTVGLIPVVTIDHESDAILLILALAQAGTDIVEITFRTPFADRVIDSVSSKFPNILFGAGTILTKEQVDKAIESGAKYLMAPGFNIKVIEYALKKDILFIPGVCTPSEVEQAMDVGLKILKFFPAQQYGGTAMLKIFYSVYPQVKFIPTGGISFDNIINYMSLANVIAVGGSWMVKSDLINNHCWQEISLLTQKALLLVKDLVNGNQT